jgi:hypothetical protein
MGKLGRFRNDHLCCLYIAKKDRTVLLGASLSSTPGECEISRPCFMYSDVAITRKSIDSQPNVMASTRTFFEVVV